MRRTGTFIAIASALLLTSSAATAQQGSAPELFTDMGMGFSVGGAFNDFTDTDVRDAANPGGGWEARYIIGTRSYIAGEAAYLGTANTVDALGLDEDAVLLSNGLEGALRLNLTADMAWQPYILGGVGWKHYNVTNTDVNTSDIRDDADALTIPVGVGLSYRYRNLVADVRGNLRPSLVEDLTASGDENDAALHTYSAHLNVGFEF